MAKNGSIPRSKLYVRTIALLRDRPRGLSLSQIAGDTGLTIGWLQDIAGSREKRLSPSVDHIELLYEYLSKHTLAIE